MYFSAPLSLFTQSRAPIVCAEMRTCGLSIPPLRTHCVGGGHTTNDLSVLPLMDTQAVSSLGLSQQYCRSVSWGR